MDVESCLVTAGLKLREILSPVIKEDYPEFTEVEVDYIFKTINGSVEGWYVFMKKWVIPHRELIREPKQDTGEPINLPQLIPGLDLKPVKYEIFEKVNKILNFYLNIYEWIENVGTSK
jgi:hypothetical protein